MTHVHSHWIAEDPAEASHILTRAGHDTFRSPSHPQGARQGYIISPWLGSDSNYAHSLIISAERPGHAPPGVDDGYGTPQWEDAPRVAETYAAALRAEGWHVATFPGPGHAVWAQHPSTEPREVGSFDTERIFAEREL